MVNKKILILFFVGILFLVGFSEDVSADWDQKIDWNGNAFDWADYGKYWWTQGGIYSPACSGSSDKDNQARSPQISAGRWYKYDCNWDGTYPIASNYEWEFTSTTTFPIYFTCIDGDGDGYASGDNPYGVCSWASIHPGPRSLESASCDGDANINPGIAEISDGIDNNCNGVVDEGFACAYGTTQSCGTDVGECVVGIQTCSQAGIWGSCVGAVGPTTETCDTKDNNCDGLVDATMPANILCYRDSDGDRFIKDSSFGLGISVGKDACSNVNYGWCPRKTSTGYWSNPGLSSYIDNWMIVQEGSPPDYKVLSPGEDCDDADSNNFPGNPEICDLKDNDCNNAVDENPNYICPTSGDICIAGTCKTPRTYWANNSIGTNEISAKVFAAPSPSQTVYLVLENPPIGVSNWEFEIYEEDTGTCILGIGPGCDDDIRVGADALTGTVLGNKVIATWTITQDDINNADPPGGSNNPYDFYFKVTEKEIGFQEIGQDA